MARGALWMVAMRWGLRLIGLVNILILARLLQPADFGVSVMAWLVVEFLIVLSDANVDIALLRSPKASRAHYDTAWTITVVAGVLTTLALVAIAPIAALYYNDERVTEVIWIVSLRALIMGFENIGVVRFRAELDFAREFRYWMWRRLLMFGVGLALAVALGDYRALALAAPASAIITVGVSFVMSSYRPRFTLVHWRELWSFSQWQILNCSARFVTQRADEVLIGGIGSAADIGTYYVASDIATMPTRDVIQPIGRALTPTYARIGHSATELRAAFVHVLGLTAILCLATGTGMALIAENAVLVLLGSQWRDAASFFRLLALCGMMEGFLLALEPLLLQNKQERLLGLVTLLHALVLVPALVLAGNVWGIEAIAVVRLIVITATVSTLFAVTIHQGKLSGGDVLSCLWRPTTAAAAMAGAIILWHEQAGAALPVLLMLADMAIGAATFFVVLLGLWMAVGRPNGPEQTLLATVARLRR
ncbi:oligosaccharide flippase family protein [Magnetospirillum molischianum]|uniref:Putative Polysaccharide biosynthesis protein n=1 Tax=Magnetospirillum molischianum DSM 120 TaxID=1150626 RepID=H8FQC6_MAGML|nr:oligosaccharide flippase family protein [Magnetospirillum molischianum]CCG40564.1 putative Polysaccharide biosynthesis protein [Magnetospirillum molischianum DSM 120]